VVNSLRFMGAAVLAAGTIQGAAATAASTDTDREQLAEVIVTAQRVQSSESKTPVSMEVLRQDELTAKGIVDIQSLAQMDP